MLGIAFVLLWVLIWSPSAHAECVVDTDSPTFVDGKRIDLRCTASGELITSGGASGGGDASAANQTTIRRMTPIPRFGQDLPITGRVIPRQTGSI